MEWETASTFLTTRAAGSLGLVALALLLAGAVWWLRRIVSRRLRSSESEKLRRQVVIRFLDDIRVVVPLMIVVGGAYLALANLSLWAAADQRPAVWLGAVVLGLVLIAAVRMARSFVCVLTEHLEQRLQTPEQLRVLQSIVPQVQRACTGAIVVVGALVILDQVGVSVTPLLTGLGIGGIAVAFAAQNTLANLLAGLSIFIDGTVRVGDMVELDGGQRGFVEDVGWRTTKLRLFANNLLIVPNGKLAESILTNYQMPNDEVAVYVSAMAWLTAAIWSRSSGLRWRWLTGWCAIRQGQRPTSSRSCATLRLPIPTSTTSLSCGPRIGRRAACSSIASSKRSSSAMTRWASRFPSPLATSTCAIPTASRRWPPRRTPSARSREEQTIPHQRNARNIGSITMNPSSECVLAHPTVTLRCTSCGATYADTEPLWACVCGSLLTVDYEWPAVALVSDREATLEQGRQATGLWRYAHFLPLTVLILVHHP